MRRVHSRVRLWVMLDVAAVLLLGLVSVSLGMELHASGWLELLAIAFAPADVGVESGELLEVLVGTLPWLQVVLLLGGAAAVALLSTRAFAGPELA